MLTVQIIMFRTYDVKTYLSWEMSGAGRQEGRKEEKTTSSKVDGLDCNTAEYNTESLEEPIWG